MAIIGFVFDSVPTVKGTTVSSLICDYLVYFVDP